VETRDNYTPTYIIPITDAIIDKPVLVEVIYRVIATRKEVYNSNI